MNKILQTQDIANSSLYTFLLLTFGISWGLVAILLLFTTQAEMVFGPMSGTNPLFILAVYGPAIAAFLLVYKKAGIIGLRLYLSRFLIWKNSKWWYIIIIIGIPLMFYSAAILNGNFFTDLFPFRSLSALFITLGLMLIMGPLEEFGWRGFALPLLQRRFTPIIASIILGIIWGIWHLPAFFLDGTLHSSWSFLPFFLSAIAMSIIMTVLYNDSRGSILLVMLFHFQLNNPVFPDVQPYDIIFSVLVALLFVIFRYKSLTNREEAVKSIIPGGEKYRVKNIPEEL